MSLGWCVASLRTLTNPVIGLTLPHEIGTSRSRDLSRRRLLPTRLPSRRGSVCAGRHRGRSRPYSFVTLARKITRSADTSNSRAMRPTGCLASSIVLNALYGTSAAAPLP